MTEDEVRQVVRESVRETLTTLGLDMHTPGSIFEAQADFRWIRRTRRGSEDIARRARLAAMAGALSGLLFLVWEGLRAALGAKIG